MLYIYICEDEISQLTYIKESIQKYILIYNLDLSIAAASTDPHTILDAAGSSSHTGIYFLDINLNTDIDGLELAQKIREIDPRGFIVFITSHSEMASLTFQMKLEVLDYIIKDHPETLSDQIFQCLSNALKKYACIRDSRQKTFSVKIGDCVSFISLDEILYFKTNTQPHKVTLYTINMQLEFNSNLNNVFSKLDSRFYRCHRSYIINADFVRFIHLSKKTITMSDGQEIMFSSRKKNEILRWISSYHNVLITK